MPDVFISYSRKDKAFVRRLHAALAQDDKDVWVDWEDIPVTADWRREIETGIASSDAFVFIISPDSIQSEICREEVEKAAELQKRFVPVLYREITDPNLQNQMHPSISTHNWLIFTENENFDAAYATLLDVLATDLSHVRLHTKWLVRAREWEAKNRNPSSLLVGDEITDAESWLASSTQKEPVPTPLHTEYILRSREAWNRRQRRVLLGVTVALIVTAVLAITAFIQFGRAEVNARQAVNNASTAVANAQTATVAQGRAADNESTAVANAQTATVAQGLAEINATLSADNEATAIANAGTATVAQGQAEINAGTALAAQATSDRNARIADIQANIAERNATRVAEERDRAQSIALASSAELQLDGPVPDRGALLGVIALEAFAYSWQAERALGRAVMDTLEVRTLPGHAAELAGADISSDGLLLVTGSFDNTAVLWDVVAGEEVRTFNAEAGDVLGVRFSPDDRLLATTGTGGMVMIWDVATGERLSQLEGHVSEVNGVVWSPDGTAILTYGAENNPRIWNLAGEFPPAVLEGHSSSVQAADWSPDGERIATVSRDGTARVWSPDGMELLVYGEHFATVNDIAFSPDGTRLASTGIDRTVRVWSAETGETLHAFEGHIRNIRRVRWSPDGRLLASASDDDTARVWDTETDELRFVVFAHDVFDANVTDITWSPDGMRLATIGEAGGLYLWDAQSGGELLMFDAHQDKPLRVFWTGDQLVTASQSPEEAVRLWPMWPDTDALVAFALDCCADRLLTDEESRQFNLPVAPSAPVPDPIEGCPNAMPSRLYPGVRGTVTEEDTRPLNVRNGPGLRFDVEDQIPPDQVFRVVEGPTCSDQITWFQIRYGINADLGWIAEGTSLYFVEPLP